MGKAKTKDVIEFPDSTVDNGIKFKESDLRLLDESETTEASYLSSAGSRTKFNPTVCVHVSAGFFLAVLNGISRSVPAFAGFISLMFGAFLYEWQRLHASKLTRCTHASFNYKDLLAKDTSYIPYYTLGWLFGEKFKGFVLPCTGDPDDERTPNEPEAVSPERIVPEDPKFHR